MTITVLNHYIQKILICFTMRQCLPPVIAYCPSMAAVAEKAQHDPQEAEIIV